MGEWTTRFAKGMTGFSVRRPAVVLAIAGGLIAIFLALSLTLVTEVGYSAYFGRHDPRVDRVVAFQQEFGVGLQLLVVFGCQESPHCERIDEPWTLAFLGKLHSRISALPNILNTTSLLNVPVVVGPLESETLAVHEEPGEWTLRPDWQSLLGQARSQGIVEGTLLSEDSRTAGLIVELRSIDSEPLRDTVHQLFDIRDELGQELGAEIFMAGEPIYNVVSSDMIARDSMVGTVGIFVTMFGILWFLFRDPALTLLPLASIGPLFVVVRGTTALLSIPVTLLLGIVPLAVLVISLTGSVHLLTAFVRSHVVAIPDRLVAAAETVGAGCFWAAVTTAAGFCTFLGSDLQAFRDVGLLSAIGCLVGFLATFTILPALLSIRGRYGEWVPAAKRTRVTGELLAATYGIVSRRSGLVLAISITALAILALGATRLYYAADVGFGDRSYVVRSFRFIESNLGRSETIDVSVTVPAGARIYDEATLRVLADVEKVLEAEAYNGRAWSFLDLLQEAFRVDKGRAPSDLSELVETAPRTVSIVVSLPNVQTVWSESIEETADGDVVESDRARIWADRGWLGAETRRYTARMREAIDDLQEKYRDEGYVISLEGGLILIDHFFAAIRTTQQESFALAFGIVAVTLAALLWRGGLNLLFWCIIANLLPVVGTLGIMGWAGIGIDLANAMLGALLLVVVVDDTIHMALRYQKERAAGLDAREALRRCFPGVGEAMLTSSMCLSLGFCSLLAAQWGGLVFFAFLASLGIVLAFIGDLIVLPAALLVTARDDANGS